MADLVIQKLRTLCGRSYNNRGLARAAKVSAPYLSQILNGRRIPSQAILKKIADALGVDVPRLERELLNKRRDG